MKHDICEICDLKHGCNECTIYLDNDKTCLDCGNQFYTGISDNPLMSYCTECDQFFVWENVNR